MVKLQPHRIDYANNNTPVLYDSEIDEYARAVLEDYKPELLREPGKINYLHFLESYLGMRIYSYDIYSKDPDRQILAITAFKGGGLKVFDEENNCITKVSVPAKSVIFNNSIMEPEMKSLALFSGMHEAGHIMMQWHVYTGETYDGAVYDSERNIQPFVCCRREHIETSMNTLKIRTAEEWREHHADYFAGATTMPNATFRPFVKNLLRENGYRRGSITLGGDEDWDILAEDIIPYAIMETYGVSKRAAQIKLRTSEFVIKPTE